MPGRLKQSAARWCYSKIAIDDLARQGAEMGLAALDLIDEEDWPTLKKYGLVASMVYSAATIPVGWNRKENHDRLEKEMRDGIAKAAATKLPNVITFSGNRRGMSDEEGKANCVEGLNRVKKYAEDAGVTINLELLNSKVDHKDYMCDHTAWGVRVVEAVNSPRVKLLYDIYHMQIMEGDLIRTIQQNIQWLGHFHTGGVPGRHELDNTQEVQWDGVMRGIAATGFQGYVAHEFLPTRDPLTSLRQAVDLCDV
jgi:hydroxypyruvate isomerase